MIVLCAPFYLLAGQADTAAALLRRHLPLNRDWGQTFPIAVGAALVALIAAENGDLVAAAALALAARRQLDALGAKGTRPANLCLEKAQAIIADARQDPADTPVPGELMTVEETVDAAIAVLDQHHPTAVHG